VTGLESLVARLLAGDRAALARVISLIQRDPESAALLDPALAGATGRAYTVGITGAPGAGKSTLVGALLLDSLGRGARSAVLALDPESPISGGAILGDRLRMERAAADERVFIRSLTAEASAGGLSTAVPLIVRALDAAGWPWILIETVGVGQTELSIVDAAATTVVVLTPGYGDEVQSIKAGLMEVGDVFVINKADRPGLAETHRDIEHALSHAPRRGWHPPVIDTIATGESGIARTWEAIHAHRAHLERTGALALQRRRFLRLAIRALAERATRDRLQRYLDDGPGEVLIERVERGEISLAAACADVLRAISGP
jgi:LAO/AO transport system kinase